MVLSAFIISIIIIMNIFLNFTWKTDLQRGDMESKNLESPFCIFYVVTRIRLLELSNAACKKHDQETGAKYSQRKDYYLSIFDMWMLHVVD